MSDRWCFTVFDNVPHPIVPDDEEVGYLVYQREECPTSGRLHWQGYIEFKSRKRFTTVQRYFRETQALDKFHIEPAKGQPSQCREYCIKEDTAVSDTAFEFGEIQADRKQGERNDIKEMVSFAKDNTLVDTIEKYPASIKYLHHLQTYRCLVNKPKQRLDLKVYYYWGAPGTGKSRKVFKRIGEKPFIRALCDPPKIWFQGYQGEKYLVLDDIDLRQYNREFILGLLDIYPLVLPVKGGSASAEFTRIYITSNIDPTKYDKAIQRRLTEIKEFSE